MMVYDNKIFIKSIFFNIKEISFFNKKLNFFFFNYQLIDLYYITEISFKP